MPGAKSTPGRLRLYTCYELKKSQDEHKCTKITDLTAVATWIPTTTLQGCPETQVQRVVGTQAPCDKKEGIDAEWTLVTEKKGAPKDDTIQVEDDAIPMGPDGKPDFSKGGMSRGGVPHLFVESELVSAKVDFTDLGWDLTTKPDDPKYKARHDFNKITTVTLTLTLTISLTLTLILTLTLTLTLILTLATT